MKPYTCDDVVIALQDAPVDPRTGNKVVYNASWIADRNSMIGNRNEGWVRRELDWFLSGSDSLDDMEAPVPTAFQQCAGYDGKVNSAYGHILFDLYKEEGDTLYDRMVNTFIEEGLHTRHSVAIISDRDIHHLAHKNNRKDFICTNALNFMVDADKKLHVTAQMRSMDAVWGYRADYSMWALLQGMMVQDLLPHYPELAVGDISFQVVNLHVYPRHHELLEKEAESIIEMQERSIWKKVS